jgi:predicted methyltransferase
MKNTTFARSIGRFLSLVLILATAKLLLAQEKSVRPGINKAFENPDIPGFVQAFEKEGRDLFDRRQQIVAACHLRPGMSAADIGTGTGLFARLFSPQVGPEGRVYAVDISEKFVKHVEATAKAAGLTNVVGVVCQPDSVNLPPSSIDVAFICDTYHHFEFPVKTMRSIHRALRPGGQLVLIDFHRIPGKSTNWVLKHVRAGQDVFTHEIIESGFRQLDEQPAMVKSSYFVRFEKTAEPKKAGAQ